MKPGLRKIKKGKYGRKPIPVAERSKAKVCGCSLAAIAGSNPAGGMIVCLLRVLCVSEVSATGRSLV